MSKYFKALEQGRRDRAAREGATPQAAAAPAVPATPEVESAAAPPEASEPAAIAPAESAPPAATPTVATSVAAGPAAAPVSPVPTSTAPVPRWSAGDWVPAAELAPPMAAGPAMDEHLVSLLTRAAIEAEQYRALRHHLEQFRRHKGVQVVGVSSPMTGDGKTTTAINLAGAMAQATEARVLLVDADLRHPAVRAALGLDPAVGRGFVEAIADPGLSLADVAEPLPGFNLSVVGAGELPASPYEVLRSPRVGRLLDEARREFDYVILDAPPMVPVQDCRLIGHWVDGFLMVVGAHRTPRRLLEEALNVIEPSRMLGLVFNGDDLPVSSYYAGYYGTPEEGAGPVPRHPQGSRLSHALERARAGLSSAATSARRWRRSR
jgi:capsular exopolysaccharide synthesis family protein